MTILKTILLSVPQAVIIRLRISLFYRNITKTAALNSTINEVIILINNTIRYDRPFALKN